MIFRKEVAQTKEDTGSIIVVRPLCFYLYALGSMLIAAAVCAFLALASYTKKARVTGVLVPQDGLLRLHARETAAVREQRVQEGAQVRQGDVLFVLAAERVSAGGSDADGNLAAIIASRRAAIEREALAQRALRAQERMQLMDRMAAARQQLDQIRAELALQVTRTQLAQEAVTRQRQLVGQGFVAAAAADIKEAELLAERSRELGLRRSVQGAAADIDNLESALRQMAPREAAEDAATARLLTSMDQEAGELNARREFAIRAPHDGVVTSIQAHVGQAAAPTVPLATLVPVGSELLAHLYVPSRAVGFIEAGRTVLVRYQAFPYQKFGQYAARVQSVAKAALSTQELTSLSLNAGGDSLYRVIVKLDTQHVMAYGQPQPLQAGMQLEADILLDRRRLIEWVFEPIFSLTRRA
jgi:membrane fusion protein